MMELMTLLTFYYGCATLAEDGLLTQEERFACNGSYQQIKRLFLEDDLPDPLAKTLTREQNTLGYLRFKAWEQENPELVADLKSYGNR